MRMILPVAFVLLQGLVPPNLSAASVNLSGIVSPPTYSTFRLRPDADGWLASPDPSACDYTIHRVTHEGTATSLLTYQQPAMPSCSDTRSFNWTVMRDRLMVWLNASATNASGGLGLNAFAPDAIGSPRSGVNDAAADVTRSLIFGLRYSVSDHLSWTVQGLAQGTEEGTQTILVFSPSPDWYVRWFQSGWSFGDGRSSTMQQVQLGYQGHPGPQASVTLARQSLGFTELDTTTFSLGASLHDVSVRLDYMVVTGTFTTDEFRATQTSHYPTLTLAFPTNGLWWTVSGMMGETRQFAIGFYTEDGNLSGNASLVPLSVSFSYEFTL